MTTFYSLIFLLLSITSCSGAYEVGKVAETVVALTSEDFDSAIADGANAVWFLKFYA
jgi:hypothetical protein